MCVCVHVCMCVCACVCVHVCVIVVVQSARIADFRGNSTPLPSAGDSP